MPLRELRGPPPGQPARPPNPRSARRSLRVHGRRRRGGLLLRRDPARRRVAGVAAHGVGHILHPTLRPHRFERPPPLGRDRIGAHRTPSSPRAVPIQLRRIPTRKAERDHGALPARRRPPRATPDRRGRPTPPRLLQRHRRTRCPRAGGSEVVATAATARTAAVRVSRFGDQHPSLRGNDRHVGRYDVPVSGGPGGRLPRVRVPVVRLLRAQARRARQEVLPRRPRHASRLRVLGKRRPWQGARVRRVRPAPADVRRCVLLAWSRRGRLRGPAERPAYSDPSDLGQTEGAAPQVTRSVLRRSPARERGSDLHRAGRPQRVGPASRPGSSGAAGEVVTRRTSPPPGVSPASASPSSRDPLRRARTPPSGAGSMPAVGREARAGTTSGSPPSPGRA